MKRFSLYHVDAFTLNQFKGNPACVCLIDEDRDDTVLQSIAEEMNLSETAFLKRLEGKPLKESQRFSLRWFTPTTEVSLCGHATLATAAVLFYDVKISEDKVFFETESGTLAASLKNQGILLDFPSRETSPFDPGRDLLKALGLDGFKSAHFSRKTKDLLLHLESEELVRTLKPDFERLKPLGERDGITSIIVTSESHAPYDFVSRFFAPWLGINEDPVTGAAHTVLGPYWSRILSKKELLAYQASRRGGQLVVTILSADRVGLTGNAVIVSKGELYLP